MGAEEGILYAECDLQLGISMKLRHDFAGHYNRPDIFQLHINRSAPHLYSVHGSERDPALKAAITGPSVSIQQLSGPTAGDETG
jgi:nitrilase